MASPFEEKLMENSSSSCNDWEDQVGDTTRYNGLKYMRQLWASKHFKQCVRNKRDEMFPQLLRFLELGDWHKVEKLIADGLDISDVGCENMNCQVFETSPLVHACKFGRIDCVKNLLSLDKDKNEAYGLLPLYHEAILQAAREGHKDCFRFLIESELLKNEIVEDNIRCAFLDALKTAQFDSIGEMLRDENLAGKLYENWGIELASLMLIYGCPSSCLECAVECGVNPDSHNSLGLTLLMCAVLAENVDCVKFLLEQYVELNTIILEENSLNMRSHNPTLPVGRTALMYAASLKNSECLSELLKFCSLSEIDYKLFNNLRPLFFACYYGNADCVSMLIERGAKLKTFDSDKMSPIFYAMHSGNLECVKVLLSCLTKEFCIQSIETSERLLCGFVEHVDCFRFFYEYYKFETTSSFRWTEQTFLHMAAAHGCVETARFLLEQGADIDSLDHFKCTPLYDACKYSYDNDKLVALLLENGANINHCPNKESVMVIIASDSEDEKCLKLLLDAGVDVDVSNWGGGTVFTTAMKGNGKCMKVLLESGRLLDNSKALKVIHKNAMKIIKEDKFRIQFSLRCFILTMQYRVFDWDWWSPCNFKKIIFAAVQAGICPGIIEYRGTEHSPLGLSFRRRQKSVAKYLLANLYFYPEDYIYLCDNARSIRNCMQRNAGLLKLFDHVVCQPLSLQSWSFLTVSKAISLGGPSVERGERVDRLPAPNSVKRALKFQGSASNICRDSWKILDATHPGEYIFLEKPLRCKVDLLSCPDTCYYCNGSGLHPVKK